MKKINIWAVIVSGIVGSIVVGGVWYGFLGEPWAAGTGVDIINSTLTNVVNIIATIAYALGIAFLLQRLDKEGIAEAMKYGLLVALLLIIPGVISNGLFLGFSAATVVIDSVYLLLRAVVISLILGAWKGKAKA